MTWAVGEGSKVESRRMQQQVRDDDLELNALVVHDGHRGSGGRRT